MKTHDRSPVWIGLTDMSLAVLAVALVAVNPPVKPASGVEMKADRLISAEWDVKDYDADVDLWVVRPDGKPVFYGNRQMGCVTLDQDNKGWSDSMIFLADGSRATIDRARETTAFRCLEPGHYDVGVNLFGYSQHDGPHEDGSIGLSVHVEIVSLNPRMRVEFVKDVTLNRKNEVINVASFDLHADDTLSFTDVPLAPVTAPRGDGKQ